MTTAREIQTGPMADRFKHLLNVIASQKFLRMEGLGKEVPFFVVPFCPRDAIGMHKVKDQLIAQLKYKGIRVLEINLYDLAKELMEQEEFEGQTDWQFWVENEPKHEKEELLTSIQSLVDPETKIAPAFAEKIKSNEFEVMFITGVGEVFPFIRSHTVLNNIQSIATAHPTIMFFPGDYSYSIEEGASLDLFGELRDDKYYRAFNMYEREP